MRAAPCCNKQSVKPPVEEPRSRQIMFAGLTEKSARAPSSFSPPRLAYFCRRLETSMRDASEICAPAFSCFAPSTLTSPARIIAWAFWRDSASPRSSIKTSRRFFCDFTFMRKLRAAIDKEFRDFAETSGFRTVWVQFRDRFLGEFFGDLVRTL